MNRILKIGMDVHSTNYTLCAMEPVIGEKDRVFVTVKVAPDYKNILIFIENLKVKLGMGYHYEGTKWTITHLKWLRKLEVEGLYRETLAEYMATYEEQSAKIE